MKTFGNVFQQRVAACAAVGVVDLAKALDIDERQHDDAGAAPRQRPVEAFQHHAMIGQAGQRVLAGQLADGLEARREQARQPLDQAGGEKGADAERGADRADQTPQPDFGADQRPVGRPAEPADDAAALVVQRLRFASGGTVLVGVEAQILQAREPRDQRQPAVVETVAVAEHAAHFVERQLKRCMPLGGEPLILPHRDGKAGHGAGQHRHRKRHQHIGGQVRGRPAQCARSPRFGRAPPECRPPCPGCRSGLHYSRPVLEFLTPQIREVWLRLRKSPAKCLTYQQALAGPQAVNVRFRDEVGKVAFEGLAVCGYRAGRD